MTKTFSIELAKLMPLLNLNLINNKVIELNNGYCFAQNNF